MKYLGQTSLLAGLFALSVTSLTLPWLAHAADDPVVLQDADDEAGADASESGDKDGEDKKKSKEKSYEDIVTEDAITREGVFTTHLVDGKVYFPDSGRPAWP